jgi:predicted transcriptional regulator
VSRKDRKNHEPSPESRAQAEDLAGYGLTHEQIAHVLGVSQDTVERHYTDELEAGLALALATVAKTAYQMATSGDEPAMTMFWLKTRAKWKEVQHHEVTGKEEGPLNVQIIRFSDLGENSTPE